MIIIDNFCIVSHSCCIIRNIFCNYTACSNCNIIADSHILYNANIGTNVSIISYDRSLTMIGTNCRKLG